MLMEASIYYVAFVILGVIALLSVSREGRGYSLGLLIAASFFMILIAGFRDGSGDQETYREIFNEVASLGDVLAGKHNYDTVYGEWGYLFINSAVKLFTDSDVALFVVVACLTVGIVAYTCRNMSPYPVLSMLCYYSWYFQSALGPVRHALASALVLMIMMALARRRKKIAVPILVSAISIQQVSVSAALLWVSRPLVKWPYLFFMLLATATAIAFMGGLGHYIVTSASPFFSKGLQSTIQFYMESEQHGVKEDIGRGIIFKQLSITLLCLYYSKRLTRKFFAFPILFGAYAFSDIILFVFVDFKIVSNRMSNLLSISEIVLIPMLFSLFPRRHKVPAFILISLALLYQVYRQVGELFYPYKSILF